MFAYFSKKLHPITYHLKHRRGLESLHLIVLTTLELKISYSYVRRGRLQLGYFVNVNSLEVKRNIPGGKCYPIYVNMCAGGWAGGADGAQISGIHHHKL